MSLFPVVYNRLVESDLRIVANPREVFVRYMKKYGYSCKIVDLLPLSVYEETGIPDFCSCFR